MNGTATEAEAQATADIANAALREVGSDPVCFPHFVEGRWYVATYSTNLVTYRALNLAAIAVKGSSVPCFAHWNARTLGVCERVSPHAAIVNPTIRCGAA